MFDISFSELFLIGIVALVVIGPERLPKVARALGVMVGRAQRYVNDIKVELQREANFDEIKKMQEDARESAMKLEAELKTKAMEYERRFKEAEETMHVELNEVKKPLAEKTEHGAEKTEPVAEEDPRQMKIDFGEK
jgi:sec-independent protein translocase protein TatB